MTRENALEPTRQVGRRSFLQLAAGAMTLPWASAHAASGTGAAAPPKIPRCPVGFVQPRQLGAAAGDDMGSASRRIIPAEQLWFGDRQLDAKGARLHFAGIRLPEGRLSEDLQSVTVDLNMETDSAGTIPWHMWSCSNFDIQNVGSDLDVFVPLREDGSLSLDVCVRWVGKAPRRYQAVLTTGRALWVPKLRPGTYCIPVCNEKLRFPSAWNQTRWEDTGNVAGSALRLPAGASGPLGSPVAFPHLVFAVDNVNRLT